MKKIISIVVGILFSVSCLFAENVSSISVSDSAVGWASYTGEKDLTGQKINVPSPKGVNGGEGGQVFTVSNRAELLAALSKGSKRIIYVDGIVDMTDTGKGSLIPSEVTGSTAGLDEMIRKATAGSVLPCKTYKEWKTKYTASFNYDENQGGAVKDLRTELNNAWKELITLRLEDNTTLIGLGENSGIRGVSFVVKGKKNVIVRNLSISDCYNPFPKIEDNDGLNADFDCVSIQGSSYVWIDHCSIFSTFSAEDIKADVYSTKDGQKIKWQVYDGLCDITNTNDFVTISWNTFKNHDKTMLIGNSDKNVADKGHQTITVHHNIFDGCTQRLPMVRFATIHIYNNVYTNTKSRGIDRRQDCRIYSENNWFADKEKSVTSNTFGSFFDVGSENIKTTGLSKTAEWNPSDYYKYSAESASSAKENVLKFAGNGKLPVQK